MQIFSFDFLQFLHIFGYLFVRNELLNKFLDEVLKRITASKLFMLVMPV
jgi:hypothetical protein